MWHDVRALNATASALTALVALACVASGVWWLSQRPMFTLRAVRVESMYGLDLQHVNELTVRNGVLGKIRGISSPPTWNRCAAPSRPCPGSARPACAASGRTS
jgi:uncharacterized membrane protein YfbV (UPF0208 family)